ncbi:uncharacterized protein LOC131239740 isoform X2 [Magnolia sinica]|uniref:uncharacterized protein LOC131239740 isoform X2 n=1 Tax=Magnolia sinica TaxID=86752 RepID=UPI00265A12FF|nr:uncharacterized protein LOC131239740 isoform X2 [Magnolia sinica]
MSGMDWNEIEQLPKAETEPGKVGLILDRGWRVGKKIAITGVAISSAPIVLPPLMFFSALGLAFAVPFGLFFAGYVCTDKIMRSLLSSPPPPTSEDEELYLVVPEEMEEGIAVSEELAWEKEPIVEVRKGDGVDDMEDGEEILRRGDGDVREVVEERKSGLDVTAAEEEYENEPITEEEKGKGDDVDEIEDGKEIRQDGEGEDVREIIEDDKRRLDVAAVEKDEELEYEKEQITDEKKQEAHVVDEIEDGEEIQWNEEEQNVREIVEDDKSRLDVRAVGKDKEKMEEEELESEKEPTIEVKKQKTDDVDEIEISKEIQWNGEGNGKVEEESVTAIIEDNESGLDAGEIKNDKQVQEREDVSEMTRDGGGRLDVGKMKGDEVQEGEENVRVIVEDDESGFDVIEMKKDEKVQEENVNRFDVGEMKKDEKVEGEDVGEKKKDEKVEGEDDVKEITEDDDSRVPSDVIISTVKEVNGVPKPYTPGNDEIDEDTGPMTVSGSVAPLENKVDSDPSRLPSEYSSGAKGKSSDHDTGAERVDSKEHSDASSKPNTVVASETKTNGSSPDEMVSWA